MIIEKIKIIIGIIKFNIIRIIYFNRIKAISPIVKFYSNFNIYLQKKCSLRIGKHCCGRSNILIRGENKSKIFIGDGVFFNSGCAINARKNIYIGNNVKFGQNVLMYDHDHDYKNNINEYLLQDIIIEDDVWIGSNCVILKGTKIGKGSIVAAGSVISGDIPKKSMIYQKRNTIVKSIK